MSKGIEDTILNGFCRNERARMLVLASVEEAAAGEADDFIKGMTASTAEEAACTVLRHLSGALDDVVKDALARGPEREDVSEIVIATRFSAFTKVALQMVSATVWEEQADA